MQYDLAIIGGGPAGYTAAERAAVNGLQTVLFEKKAIGGICLNKGCIPTKTLLYTAKLWDSLKTMPKYGITIPQGTKIDLPKIIDHKNKIVRKLTAGVRMKVISSGATIVEQEAMIRGEENGRFNITAGNESYQAAYLLICTGSDTVIPPIQGLEDAGYWTSDQALESSVLPESLAVIGGGVIGMEFASFFNSLGVKVDIIEMLPEILGTMDSEISRMLRAEYEKRKITFHLETKVTAADKNGVTIEKDGISSRIEAGKILVCTGRKAVTTLAGLDKLSVGLSRNGVEVDQHMQTSHPRVYACGDITGGPMLAHAAIRESEVAVNHILGIKDQMNYDNVPGVVYTNPEMAGCGKTEDELTAVEQPYRILKLPMTYSGRFIAENDMANGLCKLILDSNEHIIGCHILGNPASELIVIAGIAIQKKFTVEEFQRSIFAHPTVGEIFHEALFI